MAEGKFVSYLRVSTDRQGRSGLGLEAQRAAVVEFLNGGSWELLAEYVEVESGKKVDRPELEKALQHCRLTGAALLIAKIDRLSRDAHFLLGLEKAGIEFLACDMPSANRLTVGIMAMVAEEERRMISQRTKDALRAAKARGVKLGNPRGAAHLRGRGNAEAVSALKARADQRAVECAALVRDIREEGITTARGIAAEFNRRGILTPRGGKWHPTSIARLLKRSEPANGRTATG
jgi:DNA invertase Pin-like site-specific DNA recombinase